MMSRGFKIFVLNVWEWRLATPFFWPPSACGQKTKD
jgi:hypothetical protein